MGDHAECVELDFDPNEISYHKLLEKFFQWHNAFRKPYARQYMSAILLHNQEQRQAVEMILPQIEDKKRKVRSEIADYHGFTWAEDYHQKYWDRVGDQNPYCMAVIPPKLAKLRKGFGERLDG